MNYQEFAEELKCKFAAFVPKKTPMPFNVLDEMHANENAHTRILARLLQEPEICKSFIEYVAAKRSDLASALLPYSEKNFFVSCQTGYVDIRITYGDKLVIIENKVKDAVDQDAQIDRYVQQGLLTNQAANIFVIYLTKDGNKTVSDYSFKASKGILGYESELNSGRFISLNYARHIVDWLSNNLKFSIAESKLQVYLQSGILQYLHYLKGPELLDCRKEEDPCWDLRIEFEKAVVKSGLDVAIEALSVLYQKSLLTVDQKSERLVELVKDVVRQAADGANVEYWNELEAEGWGVVSHSYWFSPSGFAVQLAEDFKGEHVVRAIEFFPGRGISYSEKILAQLQELRKVHPFFTYWWNGREVYKFPVVTREEAVEVCNELYTLAETNFETVQNNRQFQMKIVWPIADELRNKGICEMVDGEFIAEGKIDESTGFWFKVIGTERKILLSAEELNCGKIYVGICIHKEKNPSDLEALLNNKFQGKICKDDVAEDKWTWNEGWWFYKNLPAAFGDWNASFYQECLSNEQHMKDCQKCIYELILELANAIREEGRMEVAK